MLNMDLIIGGILEYYKLFLIAIGVYVLARIFIKHRKKIVPEYICPNCKTLYAERVPRSIFEKLIHLNNATKKFKCLKCWKVYYVRETSKQVV